MWSLYNLNKCTYRSCKAPAESLKVFHLLNIHSLKAAKGRPASQFLNNLFGVQSENSMSGYATNPLSKKFRCKYGLLGTLNLGFISKQKLINAPPSSKLYGRLAHESQCARALFTFRSGRLPLGEGSSCVCFDICFAYLTIL